MSSLFPTHNFLWGGIRRSLTIFLFRVGSNLSISSHFFFCCRRSLNKVCSCFPSKPEAKLRTLSSSNFFPRSVSLNHAWFFPRSDAEPLFVQLVLQANYIGSLCKICGGGRAWKEAAHCCSGSFCDQSFTRMPVFLKFESSLVRRSGEQSARAAAPLAAAGLKIEFGEIPPPASRYGAWKMF